MKKTLAGQLVLYQSNVLPVLLEKLAEQLQVSTAAISALEVGYMLRNNCWVFPERDEHGGVIGLLLRQWNGKKYMTEGSKRGLIYVPHVHHGVGQPKTYQAGPQNWTRTSDDLPCPICGKPDWCMVSSEDPEDPKAVLCCRVKTGATRTLGEAGHLHIRKAEGELTEAGSVLLPSPNPVLIVEGATDVVAARDINFVAVGRPSSTGRLDMLAKVVAGREVIVCGENDAGAGLAGMEATYEVLRPSVGHIAKMVPPEGVKDLRQWINQGLTEVQFLGLIRQDSTVVQTDNVLASVAPLDLAKQWLEATYHKEDLFTLRVFHGGWYAYDGQCYKEIEKAGIRQQLYRFLDGKQFKKFSSKGGFDLLNYDPTKQKLDQIVDALLAYCPITSEEIPCWLDQTHATSNPRHVLIFPNGYLDITGYTRRGEDFILQEPTPHFFSLACYPYAFNPEASCGQWLAFLQEIFADDSLKITLLQEWFGYNLIPDNSQEKFMMFLGPTRAGKGTILEVLAYMLGEDQVVATSFKDYTRRFAIFPFLGKLAAVIGDVSVSTNYDATEALNLLKRITGNDPIMIERKGRDITQACIKLYTRFTMAANVMPRLPDFARTIESRMLIIQFLSSYMGREDTTLKTRLRMEAPGILLWALEGLRRLQMNRDFTLPATHGQVLRRVRSELTPLTEFIEDTCSLGEGIEYFILAEHLYDCWRQWAVKNGEQPQSIGWLYRSIQMLFPGCYKGRRLINGHRTRIVHGLRLQEHVAKEMGVS